MNLGVTMLASLGRGHFNDFAGPVLDDHKAVLAESGALHRVRLGRARIGALELKVLVLDALADERRRRRDQRTCASSAMVK